MASIRHHHILVGVETDPTRMFPTINHFTLTMAGALFDQTQVLRPCLPVYKALETLQQSGNPGSDFQPRLLSIGASLGQMPLEDLQPFDNIPLGLLQKLPLVLTGPAEHVDDIAAENA